MQPSADNLRRAALVVFGCVLAVSCVCVGIYANDVGGSSAYVDSLLGLTIHVEQPSSSSYLDSVFPRYKSFDPSEKYLRFVEKAAGETHHTKVQFDFPRTHEALANTRPASPHPVAASAPPAPPARTQSKFIPAKYNPEVSDEMHDMMRKWSAIVKELDSVQDMLECAAKCPAQAEEDEERGGAEPTQAEEKEARSQSRALLGEVGAGGEKEGARAANTTGSEEERGEEGGRKIVSTSCLVGCGVPAELLNFSQAAQDLGRVSAGDRKSVV